MSSTSISSTPTEKDLITEMTTAPAISTTGPLPIGWLIVGPGGYPDSWYKRDEQCPDADTAMQLFAPDHNDRAEKFGHASTGLVDGSAPKWTVVLALPTALYPTAAIERIPA